MFFRKSMSVFLASMLLFLNLGLGVIAHYCKGELAEISGLYSLVEDSCEMQADLSEKKSCCAEETLIPDSCCKNEVISFEENQPKITEFVSFDFFSPAVITAYVWQNFKLESVSIQEKNKPEYAFESNAPPLYKLYTQYVFYG
jgi:hypothetical protein